MTNQNYKKEVAASLGRLDAQVQLLKAEVFMLKNMAIERERSLLSRLLQRIKGANDPL